MADTSPIRPTDDDARAQAQALLHGARFAALGVIDPTSGAPSVTRIALVWLPGQGSCTLISTLSGHTTALRTNPACSLLVGEPGEKGDPLTHPRLTVQASATPADKVALRDAYLAAYPKAQLYYDFGDFGLIRFVVSGAFLNGGFGKAFALTPQDLGL